MNPDITRMLENLSRRPDYCIDCLWSRFKVRKHGRVDYFCSKRGRELSPNKLWSGPCSRFRPA